MDNLKRLPVFQNLVVMFTETPVYSVVSCMSIQLMSSSCFTHFIFICGLSGPTCPISSTGEGILDAKRGAWCLGKGAFALPVLQHFVRLAGKCTGSLLTVYFALVAELNGHRTLSSWITSWTKATTRSSIVLSYPCPLGSFWIRRGGPLCEWRLEVLRRHLPLKDPPSETLGSQRSQDSRPITRNGGNGYSCITTRWSLVREGVKQFLA